MDGTDWCIDHPQRDPAMDELARTRRLIAAADRLAELVELDPGRCECLSTKAICDHCLMRDALAAYLAARGR